MYYETDSTCVNIQTWHKLMKGARPMSYKWLKSRIKHKIPSLYDNLGLDFYNPWENDCKRTKTHYILVHSGIEYFIHK